MLIDWLEYQRLVRTLKPRRYRNLIKTIFETRPRRLVEIGVWNGVHAVQMVSTAAAHHNRRAIEYFGFDLFEDLSDEMLAKEFSKRPPPMRVVRERLTSTGAQITLFKGNTKETLAPGFQEIGAPDFVFIDGLDSAMYSVERMDPVDRFQEAGGTRDIAMVRVTMNGSRPNPPRRA